MKIDKRLFRYVRHMRSYLATLVGLSTLMGVFIVLQAHFLTQIINAVFLHKQALAQVLLPLGLLALVMVARSGLTWIAELVGNFVASRAKQALRQDLFAHLLRLGPLYVQGERSGELVNTVTEGTDALDAYFSQVLPQVVATGLLPCFVLLAVFIADPLSALVLFITLPILPIFMILIGKQANAATQRRWHLLSQMSAHFLDVLQGSTTLKLFGRDRAQRETIRRVSERFGVVTLQVLRIAFLSALVMEMGATISVAVVAVEVGLRLLYGQMAFTPAFFVLLLAPEFYQPLRALGPQFHASMNSAAGAQRIFDILATPVHTQAVLVVGSEECTAEPVRAESLQFKHVSYAYDTLEDGQNQALRDVSFTLRRGQQVALVGPSGAGKTTCANLILRFIEPAAGEICVDNKPSQDMTPQAWRKLIAWQPQRPYLFNTTVADNIRMGRSEATLAEVMRAAQQASIHDFILTLPQGYATIIGERGTRLSGGQAQRLSLARAFLKDAPILLLDEATSTLDPASEEHILQVVANLAKDRMVLTIAHRLNTIQQADQILLLQAGQLVAAGTHQDLQRTSVFYQQLLAAYSGEEVAA